MTTEVDADATSMVVASAVAEDEEQVTFDNLVECCQVGTAENVRELLLKVPEGSLVNNEGGRSGYTPLDFASFRGRVDVVKTLLAFGASIDKRSRLLGQTPLFGAAGQGHTDVVDLLLSRGANIDAVDKYGQTPLFGAAEQGHADVVELLLSRGASVEIADEHGRTALHCAAEGRHKDVVELLLSRGASVDAVDRWGRTALLQAAKRGHADVVEPLLSRGASVEVVDINGRTPLHIAALYHTEMVELMLYRCPTASVGSPCACVDPTDHNGAASLLAAARDGHFDIARVLLEAGVSPVVQAADCETVLTLAARIGAASFVSTLFELGWLTRRETVKDDSNNKVQQDLPSSRVLATVSPPQAPSAPPTSSLQQSLLSLTFQSLSEYAEQVYEFKAMWSRLVERLSIVLTHEFQSADLRERDLSVVVGGEGIGDDSGRSGSIERKCSAENKSKNNDHFFQLAMIAFHFVQLKTACSSSRLFARLVAAIDVTAQIRDIHTELTFLEQSLSVESAGVKDISAVVTTWDPVCLIADEVALLALFRVKITEPSWNGWFMGESANDDVEMLREAASMLQHKILPHGESCSAGLLELLKLSLLKGLIVSGTSAASVSSLPDWFIPPHELDVDIDSLPKSRLSYVFSLGFEVVSSGRWAGSIVATVDMKRDVFVDVVNTCYKLNHPNVIKLYGASYTSSKKVVVVEKVVTSYERFLDRDMTVSEACQKLLEVALGLQYLAERGIELGFLRYDDIWIDNDGVAKILVFGCADRWMRQTHREELSPAAPASVRSLGGKIYLKHRSIPAMRRLAEQMEHEHPKQRPTIATVVLELKHIVDQQSRLENRPPSQPSPQQDDRIQPISPASDSLDTMRLPELGMTLQEYVEHLERKSQQYKEPRDAVDHIFERTRDVLSVIRAQHMSRDDAAVSGFIKLVVEFNRFLGNAVSDTSVLLRAKSQKVSLESHVFHRRLDELVALLSPSTVDTIHTWQSKAARQVGRHELPLGSMLEEDEEDPELEENVDSDPKATAENGACHTTWRGGRNQATVTPPPTSATDNQPARERPVRIKRFDTTEISEALHELEGAQSSGRSGSSELKTAAALITGQHGTKHTSLSRAWFIHVHELQYDPSRDKIGDGFFGAVYKATWHNTPAVVKLMGYEADADAYDRELFAHELRVWFPLSHPHVLKLFGACDVGKRYFVCEHAGGGNLLEYVKKSEANGTRRWQLLHQAARGLQYLHEQNVVHNDLKCDNVLIGANADAKIIDFGLSSLMHRAEVTVDPKRQGAVQWRSPEYIRGERVTLVSDVYSFGMLIVELVTGEPPWGRTIIDAMVRRRVTRDKQLPPRPASMSDAQWTLIQMMCASEASQRVAIPFVVSKLSQFSQQQQ